MARGDVVNNIADVAAGAYLSYQPAAGVEAMITTVGINRVVGTAKDIVICWNANQTCRIFSANTTAAITPELSLKLFINNTNYLSIWNNTAGATKISYCGIQTK